jgi:hypothetical protein
LGGSWFCLALSFNSYNNNNLYIDMYNNRVTMKEDIIAKGDEIMKNEITPKDQMFRRFQMHKFKSDSTVPTVTMTVSINVTQMKSTRLNQGRGHFSNSCSSRKLKLIQLSF